MSDRPLRRVRALVAAAAILVSAGALPAQITLDSLPRGTRVFIDLTDSTVSSRLRRPSASFMGAMLQVTPSTVILRAGVADSISLPRQAITRIERSLGRSRTRSAIRIGVAYGLLGVLMQDRWSGNTDKAWLSVAGSTALGAAVGAIFPWERWRRIAK